MESLVALVCSKRRTSSQYSFDGPIVLKLKYGLDDMVVVYVVVNRTPSLPSTAVSIKVVKEPRGTLLVLNSSPSNAECFQYWAVNPGFPLEFLQPSSMSGYTLNR